MNRNRDDLEQMLQSLHDADLRFSAGFRGRVMQRVRTPRPVPLARLWDWIATPRTLVIRPVTAGLALAAAVAVAVLGPARPDAPTAEPVATAPAAEGVAVEFVLLAPEASTVSVTGDFVNWDPDGVVLERADGGRWIGRVRVPPGVHHYVFVVDGTEWRPDPNATTQVDDGFGQQNSVLLVPESVSG